jgi:hypothetical protein
MSLARAGAVGANGPLTVTPSATGLKPSRRRLAKESLRVVELCGGEAAQLGELEGPEPEFLEHRAGGCGRVLARGGLDDRSALHDRLVKQAARRRHRHQDADFGAAAGLAEDRDVGGIAAEARDIVADPFESEDDIEHAGVARAGELFAAAEVVEMEKAEDVQAMIDGDNDNVAFAREVGPVVPG